MKQNLNNPLYINKNISHRNFSTSSCLLLDNTDQSKGKKRALETDSLSDNKIDKGKGRATEADLEPQSQKEAWEVAYNSLEGSGLSDSMRKEFATEQTNYNPDFNFSDLRDNSANEPENDSSNKEWLNSRTSMAQQKLAEFEQKNNKSLSNLQDYDSDDSDTDSDVDRVLSTDWSDDQRAILESFIERDAEGKAVLGETKALKEAAKAAVLDRRANMEDLYHPFAPSVHYPYNTCATQAWKDICTKNNEDDSKKKSSDSQEDNSDEKSSNSNSGSNKPGDEKDDNSRGKSSNSGNNNPGGESSGIGGNDPGEGSSGGGSNDPGVGSSSGFFKRLFGYDLSEILIEVILTLIKSLCGDDEDNFMN